jgi:hypothetical protein
MLFWHANSVATHQALYCALVHVVAACKLFLRLLGKLQLAPQVTVFIHKRLQTAAQMHMP